MLRGAPFLFISVVASASDPEPVAPALPAPIVASIAHTVDDVAVASTLPDGVTERWAGHQVTITTRKVPLIGTVITRQDVDMLADVRRDGDTLTLLEHPCRIRLQNDAGVQLHFADAGVQNIPVTPIVFSPGPDGTLAGTWTGGWGELDVDGDGKPGFHVRVRAPICGGSMQVATETLSNGTAVPMAGGIDGDVVITLQREILSTNNVCLSLVPSRQEETIRGTFKFGQVADDATCSSLLDEGWPVQ